MKSSLGVKPSNNTVENQESTSKEGHVEGDDEQSEPSCSPLKLPGDQTDKPGDHISTNPTQPSSRAPTSNFTPTHSSTVPTLPTGPAVSNFPFPSDTYVPQPILSVVRPLTSTGLFSPPPSLPLVQLPNHPPLSPIPHDLNQVPPRQSSPASVGEQVDRLAVRLERSHIQHWLHNLSPAGEPEWDNFHRTPPTYNNQIEFWDSRYEAIAEDLNEAIDGESDTSGNIFRNQAHQQEELKQVELVETLSSELDVESDLATVVNNQLASMSTSAGIEDVARRDEVLKEFEGELRHSKQKLLFKLGNLKEEDIDAGSVAEAEARLKEFDDEHASS